MCIPHFLQCHCLFFLQKNVHSKQFMTYMCDNVIPVLKDLASPDDESVVVATLGSGAIHLLSLTRAHLTKLTSHQSSDKPLTTWTWSRDKPGLGLATGFDQNIRVVIVTNIESRD